MAEQLPKELRPIIAHLDKFVSLSDELSKLAAWRRLDQVCKALGAEVVYAPERLFQASARGAFVRDAVVILPQGEMATGTHFRHHPEMEAFPAALADSWHETLRSYGFTDIAREDLTPPEGKNMPAIQILLEQRILVPFLEKQGYGPVIPIEHPLEGGNVVTGAAPKDNKYWIFVGAKTEQESAATARRLAEAVKNPAYDFVPIALDAEHSKVLFHLDFCIASLGKNTYMACLDALAPESRKRFIDAVGKENILEIKVAQAKEMACNTMTIGDTIICPADLDGDQKDFLKKRGLRCLTPEWLGLSEGAFNMSGGAAHCSISELPQLARSRGPSEAPLPPGAPPQRTEPTTRFTAMGPVESDSFKRRSVW